MYMVTDNPRCASLIRPGVTRRGLVHASLGVLAVALLTGCGSSDPSSPNGGQSPDPRLTARPSAPTTAAVIGRSALGLGDVRDGFMYVPRSYDPGTPIPLLVALHGSVSSSAFWTTYEARAEERSFVLLAPDSRLETWDIVEGELGPDIRFIDRALTHVFDRVNVDPAKIALIGFSDGASYTISIGVSNGDLFEKLISHSPGFFVPNEPIVGKPAIFISHGTRDQILPVTTTRDRIVPNFLQGGYDVTYEEFDGGHTLPDSIAEAALDWWLGQAPSS
jgi:phospholipase/carboxylesterase